MRLADDAHLLGPCLGLLGAVRRTRFLSEGSGGGGAHARAGTNGGATVSSACPGGRIAVHFRLEQRALRIKAVEQRLRHRAVLVVASRDTPYRTAGGLLEVPNNGCLADYVTADQMVDNFEAVVRVGRGKPVVLCVGFHQETAARFLPRLRSALLEIESRAATQRIPVRYDRLKDVAASRSGL